MTIALRGVHFFHHVRPCNVAAVGWRSQSVSIDLGRTGGDNSGMIMLLMSTRLEVLTGVAVMGVTAAAPAGLRLRIANAADGLNLTMAELMRNSASL